MADISSISASVTPPVSISPVAPSSASNDATSDSNQTVASAASAVAPTTYTALATESASDIRGVGVNESA